MELSVQHLHLTSHYTNSIKIPKQNTSTLKQALTKMCTSYVEDI